MNITRRGSAVAMTWPIGAGLVALFFALLFPPAFWISFVGVALLALALTANSYRTGEWVYMPLRDSNNVKLTSGETTAGITAAVLMATPLMVAIGRFLLR